MFLCPNYEVKKYLLSIEIEKLLEFVEPNLTINDDVAKFLAQFTAHDSNSESGSCFKFHLGDYNDSTLNHAWKDLLTFCQKHESELIHLSETAGVHIYFVCGVIFLTASASICIPNNVINVLSNFRMNLNVVTYPAI